MYYQITKRGHLNIGVGKEEKTERFLAERGITYASKVQGSFYMFYNDLRINRRLLTNKEKELLVRMLKMEGL